MSTVLIRMGVRASLFLLCFRDHVGYVLGILQVGCVLPLGTWNHTSCYFCLVLPQTFFICISFQPSITKEYLHASCTKCPRKLDNLNFFGGHPYRKDRITDKWTSSYNVRFIFLLLKGDWRYHCFKLSPWLFCMPSIRGPMFFSQSYAYYRLLHDSPHSFGTRWSPITKSLKMTKNLVQCWKFSSCKHGSYLTT
jgi:hypothetical protein